MIRNLLTGTGVHVGPHDFAIAEGILHPEKAPKKLGLVHSPRVITTYPPCEDGHHYPAPANQDAIFNALATLRMETHRKLRGRGRGKAKA